MASWNCGITKTIKKKIWFIRRTALYMKSGRHWLLRQSTKTSTSEKEGYPGYHWGTGSCLGGLETTHVALEQQPGCLCVGSPATGVGKWKHVISWGKRPRLLCKSLTDCRPSLQLLRTDFHFLWQIFIICIKIAGWCVKFCYEMRHLARENLPGCLSCGL